MNKFAPFFLASFLASGIFASPTITATPPAHLAAPADPSQSVKNPAYSGVTADVKDYKPVDPKDWRELNREVGPQGGQDSDNNTTTRARRAR